MRYLLAVLTIALALPLLSIAPAPLPPLVTIVPHPVLSRRVVPAPLVQECSEQLALQTRAPYRREQVLDARGIPIGEVAAWSCVGDAQATQAEFERRKAAMIGGAR